jgi:hypothetical protein
MTEQEYYNLRNDTIYEFAMYFGDVHIGMIVNDVIENNYYIIPPSNFKKYNLPNPVMNDIGVRVKLECIFKWEIYNSEKIDLKGIPLELSRKNTTKLIIFGAGASYDFTHDSNFDDNKKPPLTYNLFHDLYDDILDKYVGARVFASQALQSDNIEHFFQKKWEIVKDNYSPDLLSNIINTQYYLRELFVDISLNCSNVKKNNYTSLVSLVNEYCIKTKEQVIFTSFNYDTLLEQSLALVMNYDYKKIDDYISYDNDILLFKPHGSCNWARVTKSATSINTIDTTLVSKNLFSNKINYSQIFETLNKDISIIPIELIKKRLDNNFNAYPQLLVPFTDKDEFVMPKKHTEVLEDKLKNINEIIIIGWKGTEAEYLNLLMKNLPNSDIKITSVNANDETVTKVFNERRNNFTWNKANTFTEYLKMKNKTNIDLFE